MPSTKPVIVVRLDKPLHKKVVERAEAEGRTLSNMVEQVLRKEFGEKTK